MWILWKMRLWKCEFSEKCRIENVNFVRNEIFKMWIIWINEDFCTSVGIWAWGFGRVGDKRFSYPLISTKRDDKSLICYNSGDNRFYSPTDKIIIWPLQKIRFLSSRLTGKITLLGKITYGRRSGIRSVNVRTSERKRRILLIRHHVSAHFGEETGL